jgi:Ca2+-binding EF-hand superfamily protein
LPRAALPRAWLLADHPRKQRETIQGSSGVPALPAWAHSILLNPTNLQGIRIDKEGQRAKTSIKEVLEQRRLNIATGALVNELFSKCTPETLSNKISECFREFDRDNSGGLDRSRSVSLGAFFPSSAITIVIVTLFI